MLVHNSKNFASVQTKQAIMSMDLGPFITGTLSDPCHGNFTHHFNLTVWNDFSHLLTSAFRKCSNISVAYSETSNKSVSSSATLDVSISDRSRTMGESTERNHKIYCVKMPWLPTHPLILQQLRLKGEDVTKAEQLLPLANWVFLALLVPRGLFRPL